MKNMFLPLKSPVVAGEWFGETVYTSEMQLIQTLGIKPNAAATRNSWMMVYVMPNGLFLKFAIVPSSPSRKPIDKDRRWEIMTESEKESKIVSQYISRLIRDL